ncbi:PaaX family transcriptional regulator C-terminal domain-containing protein [Streptomyces sp. YKOK-I1]
MQGWNTASSPVFLRRYGPVLDVALERAPEPLEAFRTYVPMLTQWRRLPYRDPGLPLDLLPPDWKGVAAAGLFERLDALLRPAAASHAAAVVRA